MLNPPVVVFTGSDSSHLKQLAGTIEPAREEVLRKSLEPLLAASAQEELWELSQQKPTWQPYVTTALGMRNPPESWRDYLAWHAGPKSEEAFSSHPPS